jgi:putative photosynthetic complex assembly protein 2
MTGVLLAALFATLLWWGSTGLIFYLDSLPPHTFRWSITGASLLTAGALYLLWRTAGDTSDMALYSAFAAGLLVWGWQEMSFYMGYITGPRKIRCKAGCRGWRHFGHAIEANLWHELFIIAGAAVIYWLTLGGENWLGLATYLTLWLTHLSARLNVFLGVRNVSSEFVPEHLTMLHSFLRRRSMNLLFPWSVTVLTILSVLFVFEALDASGFAQIAWTMLAALMVLAVLEHWLLVVPFPVGRMWDWSLSSHNKEKRDNARQFELYRLQEKGRPS